MKSDTCTLNMTNFYKKNTISYPLFVDNLSTIQWMKLPNGKT